MPAIPPPTPKARRLLAVIADGIARDEIRENRPWTFLSYSTALARLEAPKPEFRPGTRLQKHGLNELNDWTREFSHLPKIAALIVEKKTMRPNPRFAESHGIATEGTTWLDWWMDQANRSIRYDWSPYVSANEYSDALVKSPFEVAEGARAVVPDARDILRWLAAGSSEADILQQHPELTVADIRASLNRAARLLDRRSSGRHPGESRFSQRWAGKFKLPDPDPSDPRLTYLLERYLRNR